MKNIKTLLIVTIALTLTFGGGLVAYSMVAELQLTDYVIASAIGLIVIISIVLFIRKLKEQKKGLPVEDELSKRIREKAASHSFAGSFYLWTLIMMFTIDSTIRGEVILGIGIAGMGFMYLGLWLYYNNKGVESANQD